MQAEKIAGYFDLTDKVIVVTGGSRGLGLAMSRAFAEAGAHVVISSRKAEGCARAAEWVERETGRACLPVACHVGDWNACDALVQTVYETYGRIDVLVNNAGMSIHGGIESTSIADLRKVMAVNHDGLFLGIKTCVPALAEAHTRHAGGGAIVNNLSMASYMSNAGNIGYHVSKAAGRMLTLCAANEFGPRRIRVNSIHPGVTMTPLIREGLRDYVQAGLWPSEDEAENALAAMSWLKTTSQPEDTAHAFVYLASEEARFVTGAMIMHDGGIGSVY